MDTSVQSRSKGAPGSQGAASPQAWENPRWENGQGGFPEQTPVGANVLSLRRVSFARRQLPDQCFMEFVRWPAGPDCPSFLLQLFPTCEKKEFSRQIRLIHRREHIWSEFQSLESPFTQAGKRETLEAKELPFPMHKTGLGGKNASVSFQRKSLLRLVFHH